MGGKFCIKLRWNPPIRFAPPARSDPRRTHSGNFVFSNETKNLGLMASCRNSGRMPRPQPTRRGGEGELLLVSEGESRWVAGMLGRGRRRVCWECVM